MVRSIPARKSPLSGSCTTKTARPVAFLPTDARQQHVCDQACGQGWLTREVAQHDTLVTGIDLADSISELARQYEVQEPLGINYVHDNLHYRPLATYLNTLVESGFALEQMAEPVASDKWTARTTISHEIPALLFVRTHTI